MTLRVGFNARLLFEPRVRGWNRYTTNLLAELPPLGVHPVLYSDREVHPKYLAPLPEGGYTVRVSPPMGYVGWMARWLPSRCREDRLDVFHSPFNFGLPPWSPCPRVLTLHDAIFHVYRMARQTPRQRWSPAAIKSRLDHWIARTRADRIITVSQAAKSDIVEALGVPAEKVAVIHEAPDPTFRAPVPDEARREVRRRHRLPERYFFYVGGWEDRKNIPFLLRAFAQARPEGVALVLAGGRDDQRADLTALAESLGIGDRLNLLGWVEDEDLPALFAEALGFVYPSMHEGFGLQLCEAMAVGCPCLAARATSLPEVLGSGGETFGLDDTAELEGLLRRVADDPSFRDDLAGRARVRAGDFSWARTAEATAALYRQLAEGRRRPDRPRTASPVPGSMPTEATGPAPEGPPAANPGRD